MIDKLRAALANRYVLEDEIGRGGMAIVHRARDLRHARPVAIKVFRAGVVGGTDAATRFLQEIRIAAQLAHPHILPLHDSGSISIGPGEPDLLYYVMPYVAGASLRERLREVGRLPIPEAVRIARGVAAALDHAHRRHVVHRDVKPENILLQEGEAVVADFGIARALEEAGAETLTAPGLAVGTPAYMSPEQVSGDEVSDGRSDQYALACVLYEMLVGEPPFAGGNARATMLRHATENPEPLRVRRPEVPGAVDRTVAKALEKHPGDRFPTLADFGDALVASDSDPLLAALGPPAARSIAVLPFVNASNDPENEYLSDGMTDELIHLLANVEGLHVASRTSVFATKGQREDVRSLGARLGVAAVLEGSVRKAGPRLRITAQLTDAANGKLLWSERFDRDDRDVYAIQEDLARTIVGTLRMNLVGTLPDPVPRRYTENMVAYNLYLRGRHAWNRRTAQDTTTAIDWFERAIAEDPGYALAYTGLADAYALQLDYRATPVADGMRRARDMAHRALALDETLAEAHTSLGWVTFIHDWDWEATAAEFRRAIELNPRYATARQWYSWFLAAMGQMDEALREGRRAAALDSTSVSVQRSLGWLHYFARDTRPALEQLERALVLNPESQETHVVLALVHLQANQLDAAEVSLREALEQRPDDATAMAARAHIAMRRGAESAAREIESEMQALARDRYISPADFVKLYLALGDRDRVFEWMARAYEERRGWMAYLRVEPLLDPLRDDPRLAAYVARMRLDAPLRA